jgi:hypothetical protein
MEAARRGALHILAASPAQGEHPATVLALQSVVGLFQANETRAEVTPFVAEAHLVDAVVRLAASNGMGGHSQETHHVLRQTAVGIDLACTFDGSAWSGMEDVNSGTQVEVRLLSRRPVRFAVEARHSGSPRHDLGIEMPRPLDRVEYLVPESGACQAGPKASEPDLSLAVRFRGIQATGPLGPATITPRLQEHRGEVTACARRPLAENPGARGLVAVRFTISPTGAVSEASLARDLPEAPAFGACLRGRVRTWSFSAHSDGPTTVTATWELLPPGS